MKVVSVVVVSTTLLALVVRTNDKPDNELSLQQLDSYNAMIKADGELSIYFTYNHPIRLRLPYQFIFCVIFTKINIKVIDLNLCLGQCML